jgi:hypothetical protein
MDADLGQIGLVKTLRIESRKIEVQCRTSLGLRARLCLRATAIPVWKELLPASALPLRVALGALQIVQRLLLLRVLAYQQSNAAL